jgi:hypothetical protein
MSTEIETRARALYEECVRLLSDRKPLDPALVETATGGKVTADSSVGNGLEYCKVIVSVLDHVVIGPKGATAQTPKRRGRPKGSTNKPAAATPAPTSQPRAARTVTVAPKKTEAKTTRSGRDVTADAATKAPAKKRGRPKGSKNKPKTEAEAAE